MSIAVIDAEQSEGLPPSDREPIARQLADPNPPHVHDLKQGASAVTAHNILVPGPLQSLIRRQDELLVAQDAWDDELETKKVELGTDYTIDQLAKLVVMENRRNEKLEAEKAELEAENERLKAEKAGLKSKLRRIIDAA